MKEMKWSAYVVSSLYWACECSFSYKDFLLLINVQRLVHTLVGIFEPFSLEDKIMSPEDFKMQNDVHVVVQEMKEICFCPWV